MSQRHLLVLSSKPHLFVNPVLNMASLFNLNDSWPVSGIDKSHLIISVHLVQFTDFYKIVNDFSAVGSSEDLLSSSSLSPFYVPVPAFDGSFVRLIDFLCANGTYVYVLVEDAKMTNGVVVIHSLSPVLSLD